MKKDILSERRASCVTYATRAATLPSAEPHT
jgi:hypothetical protein